MELIFYTVVLIVVSDMYLEKTKCFDNFKSVYRSKCCGRFKFLPERSVNFKCFQIEIQRASGFETTPDS